MELSDAAPSISAGQASGPELQQSQQHAATRTAQSTQQQGGARTAQSETALVVRVASLTLAQLERPATFDGFDEAE